MGFGSTQIRRLSDAFGDPREVLRADAETLQRRGGLSPKSAARLASFSWEATVEAELQRADGLGVRIRTVEDEGEYPVQLREIYDPPPVLYVLGRLPAEEGCPVAVVGTRRPTGYGRRMARTLGRDLAQRGCIVVSGMARGIDIAAHEGALEGGGRTVAVAGCGLTRVYPPEAAALQDTIIEKGAVISERPLEDPPLPRHFPQRNRIISGLSSGTVVIEAAERGGGDDAEPFLAGDEAKIFGLVSEDDKQIEQLITESRLSPADVSGALMALELKGLIRQYPGKVFARA